MGPIHNNIPIAQALLLTDPPDIIHSGSPYDYYYYYRRVVSYLLGTKSTPANSPLQAFTSHRPSTNFRRPVRLVTIRPFPKSKKRKGTFSYRAS